MQAKAQELAKSQAMGAHPVGFIHHEEREGFGYF